LAEQPSESAKSRGEHAIRNGTKRVGRFSYKRGKGNSFRKKPIRREGRGQ